MLYCQKCKHLCEDSTVKCPNCKSKRLREPGESDTVWLTSQNFIFGGIIEELLADNGIPCMKLGEKGEGLSVTLGYVAEIFDFYVPFSAHERALSLLEQIMNEDGEIIADGDFGAEETDEE